MSSISSSPSKQVSGYKPVAGEEVAAASETGAIEVTIPGGGGDGDDRQNQTNTGELPFYNLFAGFDTIGNDPGLCALLLTGVSVILIVLTMPFSLFFCVKILSKDSVTVAVDAVVYYRISNATIAVSNVEDYGRSTRLLAATTLRNVLGTKNLSEILSERESISHVMQSSLDEATDPWGVKVERVEIKDARLPVQLQRAMATEAEAAREARAKVIAAEGEQRASRALKEAAEVIHDTPAALHLRYLQTLNSIAAEKNSTIVFPLPIDIFSAFLGPNKKASKD
ncbi:mechanosensory protein 2-like isoform X7 [Brevipalpus obovatus]|uniref:mechanosensory protein 2-like isoform X7 n=1 Tax=Brevipalpus obovatus TaxID=246614 RepID=UPI003D9E2578